MKKLILSAALLAASLASQAQQGPLWMRYPAISPDGSTIAFAYKGDLYCVPANGGEARQLTTHAAYDSQPIWSPDGKKIAFTSNREGSLDVYVISAKGGAPTRLTLTAARRLQSPSRTTTMYSSLPTSCLQPRAISLLPMNSHRFTR